MRGHDPLADPAPLIKRVYAYVAYLVGDGAEAEDLTSETFERAVRYRESYDAARGGPLPWLIGIARRCVAGRRLSPATGELTHADEAGPDEVEARTVERLTVGAALASLSDRERELLALRYGADLSARQIGDVLGMKTNAVEVALHRALARMRAELEREEPDERLHVSEAAPGTSV